MLMTRTDPNSIITKLDCNSDLLGNMLHPTNPRRHIFGGYNMGYVNVKVLQVMWLGDGWVLLEYIDVEG